MKPTSSLRLDICAWNADEHIFYYGSYPSGSPTQQFLQIILCRWRATNLASVRDVGNTLRTLRYASQWEGASGSANQSNQGIVIGTDNTAMDITNFALGAQIAHGVGAGQMVHNAQTYPTDVTTADPNVTFVTSRTFNNNSGGAITVRETGIYSQHDDTDIVNRYFLIIRDVVGDVVVPNGGGITVTYTLQISE